MERFSAALCRIGAIAALLLSGAVYPAWAAGGEFRIEEAGIEELHRAIQKRRTTCLDIVQAYVERARAYNGACTRLVTKDGAAVAAQPGTLRAKQVLQFPAATMAVDRLLPDFAHYVGAPIEFGSLQPTASDPRVVQQFGMLVGIPDAGQLSALNTLNLRGERSVTCQAECDKAPQAGALPATCPKACDSFRQQPDALEYAASLDARYGRKPDLEKLPMYCVPFSFKDVFDTTDMRTTGGADTAYGLDAAPADANLVAQLRAKGAIIYAKANLSEYNGGAGDPGGAKPKTQTFGAGARSTWGGAACNPYDTERETGGSSSGSASSVGANLAMCSICEETGGSCRQPAWRNGVVGLVTTKGLMGYGGAIGADPYLDRAGIHCKTVRDAALVLDALKDPQRGYFDPRDIYSALPRSLIPEQPYAAFTAAEKTRKGKKPLAGMRIGIVREYMVKHAANDRAISDQINEEIKRVLRDQLGAELVESRDPDYADDPEIADMTYNFQQALAEILPAHMPEYLVQKVEGKQIFAVPGYDINHRDYLTLASLGQAPLAQNLNIRTVTSSPRTLSFSLHLAQYLALRGDATVKDWQSLNAHSKYYVEGRTVAMGNWQAITDLQSAGITQRVKMRDVMRMVVNKVMQQNDLDVLVNPTTTIPPAKIGHASQPVVKNRPAGRFPTSADLGIPEITVPAGFNSVIYEPRYVLNDKKDDYDSAANETEISTMAHPMPLGISFWAGVGEEPAILRIAAAYETATRHRKPPPAFGPLSR